MFTGIIEETGVVRAAGARLSIECAHVLSDLTEGASIAVNGVCLTALEIAAGSFSADLAPETLRRSNLGELRAGDRASIWSARSRSARAERPHRRATWTAPASSSRSTPSATTTGGCEFAFPRSWIAILVYKGSIAIDGISLTIAALEDCVVSVTIIPHTYQHTSLRARRPGDRVNLECDVLAKHVEKLTSGGAY